MNKKLKYLFFPFVFLVAQNIWAKPNALDEIGGILKKIHTMEATFEQTTNNQLGKKIGGETTGTMILERPGKFSWDIKKPNDHLIIVNKNISISYDRDLEQAVKRKIDYQNPAMLLSGSIESLKKSFSAKKSGKDWFELIPKNRDGVCQKIVIKFTRGQPKYMKITNNLDQDTHVVFKNIIINKKIPSKTFIFNPPKNVEVLSAQ